MYLTDYGEDNEDSEISIKVVIVGNGAVGKSSMIQRYCKGLYTQNYKKTIGVDFLEKQLRINGDNVRLMLWDTAGQEEFDAITKSYYRGAQACVIVFSTTDKASLSSFSFKTKIDLLHEARISADEVDRVVKDTKLRLYKTSVKEDLNVTTVFLRLAENYLNKYNSSDPRSRRSIGSNLSSNNNNNSNNKKNLPSPHPILILRKPSSKKSIGCYEYTKSIGAYDENKDYWSIPERTIMLKPIGGRHFTPSHYYISSSSHNGNGNKNKLFKTASLGLPPAPEY
ncbi:RAB23 [Lepeophtheirus salmonis]|uniref:RAB23 n=1 Tax=Lepeophtheirus salmonis TaxID=72036 RepID=A0A7R8H5I0_LEPSM|nr:RAB23 [Lepeophtheirus salmonis]CAF2880647.1 RAB23 [Lepeophtheirus salmonis]